MANEPQWEPIEAPPWAKQQAAQAEPAAPKTEPKWEPIEAPPWAGQPKKTESKPPTLGRVLERAGEAASGTFKSGLAAGKKLLTPRTKEELEEGYGVTGALKGLQETGEGLLSPFTMTIGALTSGVASPIASGVSEAARRITGGDPKHSEKAYKYALPMAEAAFGAVGRVPGAGAGKMPTPITPKTTTVPGKGPEAEAGRYLESEASDPAALRQKLQQPAEELGGAGDKPTTFQHTGQLGQVEKATARRPGQVEPHLERKAEQNAARQETLERMQPAGDPMAAVNDLRTAMQAETQAGDAAAAAAQQRATQLIEAEGGRIDPTTYGNIFRRELEIAEEAARAREGALWRQVDPDGTLQSNSQPLQELERRVYGNLPQAASLSAEETRLAGVIQNYRPVIPFSELTALRSEVSAALRSELYTNGRTPAYARLSRLRQGVEEAIPGSFTAEGEFATGVADRLRAASAATRERVERFRPTRAITRKEGVEGPYKLEDVSTIPEKIIASGTKGYDRVSQYLRAVGNERGLPELTDAVVARMRREVIGMDGEINPRKLEGFLRRYQDTLRAIDAADGGIFSARLRNIQTAQEAIETTTANRAAITKKYQDDQFNRLIGATNETDATSMIANIFGKQDSVAQAQELMRRLTTVEAQEGARAAVVRHIREMLTSNAQLGEDLLLRAEQFQRWVQNSKNNGALRQILRPDQVEALEKIALSLRRANRSNQTKAVGGGSDTYQNFLAGQAQQGAVRELVKQYGPAVARIMAGWLGGPAGAITAEGVGFGLRTVGKARAAREAKRIETVQSLIDDAILNPEKAKEYLGKTQTTKSRTPGAKGAATYGAAVLDEKVRSRDDKKRVPRQAGGGVPAIGGTGGGPQGEGAASHVDALRAWPGQALSDGGEAREQQPAPVEAKPLGFRERHAAALAGTPASGPAFEKIQVRKTPTGLTREDVRRTLQSFGITGEEAGGFAERQLGERYVDSRAGGGAVKETQEAFQSEQNRPLKWGLQEIDDSRSEGPFTKDKTDLENNILEDNPAPYHRYRQRHGGVPLAQGGTVKRSKASVDYSKGMKDRCGLCEYYSDHKCEKVRGYIGPGMWCELFEKQVASHAFGGGVDDPSGERSPIHYDPGDDTTFGARFGEWDKTATGKSFPRDEEDIDTSILAPGQKLIDPLGHRGERGKAGYYYTRGMADGGLTRGSEPDIAAAAAAMADNPTVNAMERMHRSRMNAQGIKPQDDDKLHQGLIPSTLLDETRKYLAEQIGGVDDPHEQQDPLEAAVKHSGAQKNPPSFGGSDEGRLADGGEVGEVGEDDPYGGIFHSLQAMRDGGEVNFDWEDDKLPPPNTAPNAVMNHWGSESDAVQEAAERAALRQRRGVLGATTTQGTGRGEDKYPRSERDMPVLEALAPTTPLDYGMMALGPWGRGLGLAAKSAILAGTGLLSSSDEAEAGVAGKLLKLGKGAPKGGGLYPGIYGNPAEIARHAESMVAPEHPALKELFGVTRQDLSDIGQQGRRAGNIPDPQYGGMRANPKGSYVSEGVMTRGNEQRLIDALGEAQTKAPGLTQGMDAWYVMDPLYQRMVQLLGPEQALKDYRRFNTLGSMASPGSEVMTEINRGSAANMMAHQGQFPRFQQYAGMAEKKRGADFPPELRDVIGHPYHSTAQAGPMGRYLESGGVDMTSPKVPLYIQASGVPQTGFQTRLPVADAHFTRAIGAADVRAAQGHKHPGVSMKTPEYSQTGPWFRENVAGPMGIEAVPAQARLWGLMAPQTGVDTAIGAPKLELMAQAMWERAHKLGIDPKVFRDYVLRGAAHMNMGGIIGPGFS